MFQERGMWSIILGVLIRDADPQIRGLSPVPQNYFVNNSFGQQFHQHYNHTED